MTAADAIKAARVAGVELRLEGDDLMLEARVAPPPAVLDLLKHFKAGIVEQLRQQGGAATIAGFDPTTRPRLRERSELADGANQHDRDTARTYDIVDCDDACRSTSAGAQRLHIVRSLDTLPPANDIRGHRLAAATRTFLESQWFSQALACGWSLDDLFGVDATAPLDEHEQWGLVVGLAWAPQPNDCIALIDDARAVIRFRSKASNREMRRVHRRLPETNGVVLWWECAALRDDPP